jgi:hypothetical protein
MGLSGLWKTKSKQLLRKSLGFSFFLSPKNNPEPQQTLFLINSVLKSY